MSMKLELRLGRFLIQDEHETGEDGIGVARPDASAYVECRELKPGTDPRIPRVERTDRVRRVWAEREVCVGGAGFEGAELWRFEQTGAGSSARLRGENDGDECVADYAIDPLVSRSGVGEGGIVPTEAICDAVHRRGHLAARRSGPGARAVKRAGDAAHSTAGIRAVWGRAIRAIGEDQRGASVQLASQCALPQPGGGVRRDSGDSVGDRRAAQARAARATRIFACGHCASGRSGGSEGGFTMSTRWMP